MAERGMTPISRRHPTSEGEEGHVEDPLEADVRALADEPEGEEWDSIAGGGGCVIPEVGHEDEDEDEDEEEMTAEARMALKFFTCHTCLNILREAIVFGCGHIMCVQCTNSWIAVKPIEHPVCPVCQTSYKHLPRQCELIGILVQQLKPLVHEAKQPGLKVKAEDVLCFSCQNILHDPSVLNCGHVFCLSCVVSANGTAIECKICGALHSSTPRICLALKEFLATYFESEYQSRTKQLQPYTYTSTFNAAGGPHVQDSKLSERHVGVGCDSCGVYPIQGNRYHCKACKDIDLCEECSKIDCKIQGRSGEIHYADHILELDDSFLFEKVLAALDERIENDEIDEEEAQEDDEEQVEDDDSGEEPWVRQEDIGGINAGFWWQ